MSYRWAPERKQVDLTVRQIQSDLPFENDFRIPVDVEIADANGAKTHRVQLSGWSTTVALPAPNRPTRVTFDKGGWLVCEVKYPRPIEDVLAELSGADLAGKLRASRQLAEDFPTDPRSLDALSKLLADPGTHWGLKQAATDLGKIGGSSVQPALMRSPRPPIRASGGRPRWLSGLRARLPHRRHCAAPWKRTARKTSSPRPRSRSGVCGRRARRNT